MVPTVGIDAIRLYHTFYSMLLITVALFAGKLGGIYDDIDLVSPVLLLRWHCALRQV